MEVRPGVRIGTSGYVYPHWRGGRFYPEGLPGKEELAFYARHFDTVELNNTFYRLPTEAAARGWADRVPAGFLFAVKGSRYLTHVRRLKETGPGVKRFFEALAPLLGRVGPVLWQLPPKAKRDVPRLRAFLRALPPGHAPVLEFRDPDWYAEEVFQALEDEGASLCLHDRVEARAPFPPPGPLYYRRFHGVPAPARGRYGARRLGPFAREIAGLAGAGVRCFAYFNNDARADAIFDAFELKRQVAERLGSGVGLGAGPAPSPA